jgi:hypothetical protein
MGGQLEEGKGKPRGGEVKQGSAVKGRPRMLHGHGHGSKLLVTVD